MSLPLFWKLTYMTWRILVTKDIDEDVKAYHLHLKFCQSHTLGKNVNISTHQCCGFRWRCGETSFCLTEAPIQMFCHWSFNLEAKLRLHVLAGIGGVILMLEKLCTREQLFKIYLNGNLHITVATNPAKGTCACNSTFSVSLFETKKIYL